MVRRRGVPLILNVARSMSATQVSCARGEIVRRRSDALLAQSGPDKVGGGSD